LVNISKAGLIAEFATVSNEGTIGNATFLGDDFVANLAIAQTDCLAISLPVNVLGQEFACGGKLQRIVLLYSQIFLAQVSQNVFCSCHHTLERRLARWLLSYSDRN
jgi:CRP-like cAMP-binding protein